MHEVGGGQDLKMVGKCPKEQGQEQKHRDSEIGNCGSVVFGFENRDQNLRSCSKTKTDLLGDVVLAMIPYPAWKTRGFVSSQQRKSGACFHPRVLVVAFGPQSQSPNTAFQF